MATNQHTTNPSRRAILAGGASMLALGGVASAGAALREKIREVPDAEILALAESIERQFTALETMVADARALWQVWQDHPDMPNAGEDMAAVMHWHKTGDKKPLNRVRATQKRIGKEVGFDAACDRASVAWKACAADMERLYGMPAQTPAGLLAKVRLATDAADEYPDNHPEVWNYSTDRNTEMLHWLIADLEQQAGVS